MHRPIILSTETNQPALSPQCECCSGWKFSPLFPPPESSHRLKTEPSIESHPADRNNSGGELPIDLLNPGPCLGCRPGNQPPCFQRDQDLSPGKVSPAPPAAATPPPALSSTPDARIPLVTGPTPRRSTSFHCAQHGRQPVPDPGMGRSSASGPGSRSAALAGTPARPSRRMRKRTVSS